MQNNIRGPRKPVSDGMQTASVKDHLQKTFSIHYKSTMDGKVYEGQFTTKKMSIKDMGQIGVRKSQLNGGYHYDEENPGVGIDAETNATNNMIAHFEVCLIQSPTWFNLDEIYDVGLLGEIFKNIAEYENSFFRSQRSEEDTKSNGSSPADREGQAQQSGAAGRVTAMGGEQISAALEP